MPTEPTILAFDTSAAHCAAALLAGGQIRATAVEEMTRGQAERLMPLLEELLTGAGLSWRDLDAIAVGTGPGNFTGTRISVAAARGLALGLGIPAIGISSFEAMSEGQSGTFHLPAPRGRRYVQTLRDGAALSDPAFEEGAAEAPNPYELLSPPWPAWPPGGAARRSLRPPRSTCARPMPRRLRTRRR